MDNNPVSPTLRETVWLPWHSKTASGFLGQAGLRTRFEAYGGLRIAWRNWE